ncbi:Meiotic nuclear division protein 1 [Cyanidiococcus yangmingshanensis]|uniref:Meiotic nuclear division protein 1 n=1 Tax=Cyanidiococcus yangmingshanensis TaxID=2690220 RepID=A0A7J7ICU9_9RHOD|nr:Meiotic nuclear division protein 1 [Cyanidiococcus yangmingshanensis]
MASTKRKGLSFDEKRSRLLELFSESSDFYTLKELEKVAPKAKGIISQSVKDVLQSLVDDDLVNTDKCGVQTIYWCLPSEGIAKRQRRLETLQHQLQEQQGRLDELERQLEQVKQGREENAERTKTLAKLAALETEWRTCQQTLQRYLDCDPEVLAQREAETKALVERANLWTDNLHLIRTFVSRQLGIDLEIFDQQFELAPALQYLE